MTKRQFEIEMIEGFAAATRGDAWDPYRSAGYHEGYSLWLQTPTAQKSVSTDRLAELGEQIARRSRQLYGNCSPDTALVIGVSATFLT